MEQKLKYAWERSANRFAATRTFLNYSSSTLDSDGRPYRGEIYASWVLLVYAALEASMTEIRKSTADILASTFSTPMELPTNLRADYLKSIAGLSVTTEARDYTHSSGHDHLKKELVEFESVLGHSLTSNWSSLAMIPSFRGNVWPGKVKDWLRRLGVQKGSLAWFESAPDGAPSTITSRVEELVDERNGLAHGGSFDNLRSVDVLLEWLDAVEVLVENTYREVQGVLAMEVSEDSLVSLGEISPDVKLGNQSAALSNVRISLRPRDHVLEVTRDKITNNISRVRCVRIESIMSGGLILEQSFPGSTHLAIRFDSRIDKFELFRVL